MVAGGETVGAIQVTNKATGDGMFDERDRDLLEGLAVSVVVAMAVLCWLTLRTIRRLFDLRVRWSRLLPGIGVAMLLGACSFLLYRAFHFQPNVVLLICYEIAVSGVYFGALWLFGSPWLHFMMDTMFSFESSGLRAAD